MKTLSYPAVFHISEDVGGYWVEFPDLPGCFTQGKDKQEALEMAKDALSLFFDTKNDIYDRQFNNPSTLTDISKQFPEELVMMIEVESDYYSKSTITR